jgi:hypothetical protein
MRVAFGFASVLALGAALPDCVAAQRSNTRVAEDTAFLGAVFRTAFREGLYTAHGADTPQLVCVGVDPNTNFEGGDWLRRLVDPPPSVIADLQRGRSILVRPRSACVVLARGSAADRTSRVQDTISGKRGILVYVNMPEQLADSTLAVRFAYYEHGLSAGWWKCTVRRRDSGWEVARCELLGIS